MFGLSTNYIEILREIHAYYRNSVNFIALSIRETV